MKVLSLQGLQNARDISNDKIKENRLIRSEALLNLSKNDISFLTQQLNLRVVIDLRSQEEVSEKPDISIPGIQYLHLPLTTKRELGLTREQSFFKEIQKAKVFPDLNEIYKKLFLPEKEAVWKDLFDVFLHDYDGAILWHCSAGKDRCGMVSAILEYCLNYSYEEIVDDYMFTNVQPVYQLRYKMLKAVLPKRHKEDFHDFFIAKVEYLETAFEFIKASYGSIEDFLFKACKLDDIKLKKLREIYYK